MRLYAAAFWLTEEASDDGRSGMGGAAEDDAVVAGALMGFAAVAGIAVGVGIAAVRRAS